MAGMTAQVRYSPAVQAKAAMDIPIGGVADYTWNSFQRSTYEAASKAISQQALKLSRLGTLTAREAAELATAQRNALVIASRNRLTPFGRFYSEVLKRSGNLPTVEELVARKGTYEAVMIGASRSRTSINRVAFIARRGGPGLIVIDMVLTIVIIEEAPVDQRGRIAAEQVGGISGSLVGSRYGGLAGAWAGATSFMLLGSPTLAIPVVGEVTEAGAAVGGGILVFFFGGTLGWVVGRGIGSETWVIAPLKWKG